MKSAFVACLVAAVSTALDCKDGYYETTGYTGSTFCCNDNDYRDCYCEDGYEFDDFNFECDKVGKTPFQKFKDLFELNGDGRWQLKQMPDLPQLSWNNVDPAEVESWFQGKMDLNTQQGQKWAEAWIAYQDAIAQPWNDFVDRAEELSIEDAKLDAQTDEEVIRFISDNTFVDGVSLTDKYPQIDEWITEMKENANYEEFFNFDPIKIPTDQPTPVTLQAYGADASTYTPEPTPYEKACEEMRTKLISYGYDPEVAKAWLESSGASWEELSQRQDKESMELGQQQVREASDYIKGIFDKMVVDLRDTQVKNKAEFDKNVDSFVSELKTQVDAQQKENIDNFESWFADKYDSVIDMTEVTYQEAVEMQPEQIVFATKGAAAQDNSNAYVGYGVLSMGVVLATATYLYKKQQAKQVSIDNSGLLQNQEFEQI